MIIYRISFSGADMNFEQFSYMVRIEAASRMSAMCEAYRRLYRNFDVASIASAEVVEE